MAFDSNGMWVPDTTRSTNYGYGSGLAWNGSSSYQPTWYSQDISGDINNSGTLYSGVNGNGNNFLTTGYTSSNTNGLSGFNKLKTYATSYLNNGSVTTEDNSNWGNDSNISPAMRWAGLGLGALQAGTGLANAVLGYKQYGLAKDQFNFQKALTNRNLANQASLLNTQMDSRTGIGNGLAGSTLSDSEKQGLVASTNARHVDGSSIG